METQQAGAAPSEVFQIETQDTETPPPRLGKQKQSTEKHTMTEKRLASLAKAREARKRKLEERKSNPPAPAPAPEQLKREDFVSQQSYLSTIQELRDTIQSLRKNHADEAEKYRYETSELRNRLVSFELEQEKLKRKHDEMEQNKGLIGWGRYTQF